MWRDEAWLLDMLHACRKAREHTEGLDEQRFHGSSLHQDAVIRQPTILGEAAKQVSPEYRDAHPEIPWKRIAGFRDLAVHSNFRSDPDVVWRIVHQDLPNLAAILGRLVPPEEMSP